MPSNNPKIKPMTRLHRSLRKQMEKAILDYRMIEKGDRIAQFTIEKLHEVELHELRELSKTERTGGFGSTGR